MSKPIYVEVSVTNINEHGVYLTVKDFEGNVLEAALTAREIFDGPWVVASCYYPTRIPEVGFHNPRKMINDLAEVKTKLGELRRELGLSTGERYEQLTVKDHTNPIRVLERQEKVLTMVAEVAIQAMLGMRPSGLREMGLF